MEKKEHSCLQILVGGGGGQVGGGEYDWPSSSSDWFLYPFPVNLTQDDLQLVANSALGPEI